MKKIFSIVAVITLAISLSITGCFLDEESGACEVDWINGCYNDYSSDICNDPGDVYSKDTSCESMGYTELCGDSLLLAPGETCSLKK